MKNITGKEAAELAIKNSRIWHDIRNKGLHLAENAALRAKIKYTVLAIELGNGVIEKDIYSLKSDLVSVKFKTGGGVHLPRRYLEWNDIEMPEDL